MSYSPLAAKDFPTQAVANGSISSFVLATAAVTGLYRVAVYVAPVTIDTVAGVAVTLGWTDGALARTWTSAKLTLLSTTNILQQVLPLRCDVGTNITISLQVTGSAGSYNATFGVRPPQ